MISSSGPVRQRLMTLAWPIIIQFYLFRLTGVVDNLMVGQFGEQATAALGICLQFYDISDLTRERVIWMVALSVLYSDASGLVIRAAPGIWPVGSVCRFCCGRSGQSRYYGVVSAAGNLAPAPGLTPPNPCPLRSVFIMGMTENLLSASQLIITGLIFLAILVNALRGINWSAFRRDQALQHAFFGAAVVLGFVWQLRAGISPGLSIHVFGMTLITLMLGWRLAVLSGLLALVITVITGREPLIAFAANGLVTVMVPALVSHGIMLWERKRNFRNFFAYIFFCGFFGAGISVAVAGVVMCLMLWSAGVYTFGELTHEYLRYLPLFMVPEGFVNGAFVTGLMVFHPDRLTTLDQRRYR